MVTFEFAQWSSQMGNTQPTICLRNSPLAEALKKTGLPILSVSATSRWQRFRELSRILRKATPDVILCQHLHDLWFVMPLIYFTKTRAIGLSHTFLGVSKKDPLHSLLYHRLDRLICLTKSHKRNLQTHLGLDENKIDVIPNMVDTHRFNPDKKSTLLRQRFDISPQTAVLAVVGRLDEQKGQHDAILALKLLLASHINAHLFIIGEDTINESGSEKKLRELVRTLKLGAHVTFTGYLSPIEEVMASIDILLVPSHAETFGRIIIEGMASGIAVIATAAGGVPDIIQDECNGLLVRPHDVHALASAGQRLIADLPLRLKIAQAGLHTAELRYAKTKVIENWETLLAEPRNAG